MAEGKRISSKSEDQHQKCAPEYLSCPLRQGEPRQQNVMKILPMQSQVDTNENERRRCEKIMPWLHKIGLLNRRGVLEMSSPVPMVAVIEMNRRTFTSQFTLERRGRPR